MAAYIYQQLMTLFIPKSLRAFLIFVLQIGSIFILSVIIHEGGHLITAELLGKSHNTLYIWPGLEVYPKLSTELAPDWPNIAISTLYTIPKPDKNGIINLNDWKVTMGIIKLMGSVSTLIVSILSILILSAFRPIGLIRNILFLGSFLYYDILTYTVFPHFFNLQHLIVIGGADPEPITALKALGFSTNNAIKAVLSICLFVFFSQLYVLAKRPFYNNIMRFK